jgi:hypothetical protein
MNPGRPSEVAYLFEPGDVDTSRVEMLPDNPSLFAFWVVLSGSPDPLWIRTFYQVWKESRYLNKLESEVIGESIRFICFQSQGVEDYLYFIEQRIEETNRRMRAHWDSLGVPTKTLKYEKFPQSFVPIGIF